MKAFEGYKAERSKRGGYPQLPAGPYVGKIMNARIEGEEPEQSLVLLLDVAEGEHAGYYAKRFQRDDAAYQNKKSSYPAKYKGKLWLRVPSTDGRRADFYESDLRNFNDAMACIKDSNPGYEWDWNEAGLKGLFVGINVRQGTYNGNAFTKIAQLESANDVRMGKVETLPPMDPKSDAAEPAYIPPVTQQVSYTQVLVDELPF